MAHKSFSPVVNDNRQTWIFKARCDRVISECLVKHVKLEIIVELSNPVPLRNDASVLLGQVSLSRGLLGLSSARVLSFNLFMSS